MTHRLRAMWADAIRYGQWEEADRLWKLLIAEWLTPVNGSQEYYNCLLDRRMVVLERNAQRRSIDDDEWDQQHEGVNS